MSFQGIVFEHEDHDGDRAQFSTWRYAPEDGGHPSIILKTVDHDSKDWQEVAFQGPDVRRLHSALGRWLAENNVTTELAPEPAESGLRRTIRRIVREELATGVRVATLPAALDHPADPEPRDVGHPGEDVWGEDCKKCTHPSGVHTGEGGCHSPIGYVNGVAEYCKCLRQRHECALPVMIVGETPPECDCSVGVHSHVFRPCPDSRCGCTEFTRVQPEPTRATCTCHNRHKHLELGLFFCGEPGCYCRTGRLS